MCWSRPNHPARAGNTNRPRNAVTFPARVAVRLGAMVIIATVAIVTSRKAIRDARGVIVLELF